MEEAIVVNWLDDYGTVSKSDEVESVGAAMSLLEEEHRFCAFGRWADYPKRNPDGRERMPVWLDELVKEQGYEPFAEIIRVKVPGPPSQPWVGASGSTDVRFGPRRPSGWKPQSTKNVAESEAGPAPPGAGFDRRDD